nr:ADP-ribose pyrophosphatase, mitochondrial-like [Cherax quadricarinatus]
MDWNNRQQMLQKWQPFGLQQMQQMQQQQLQQQHQLQAHQQQQQQQQLPQPPPPPPPQQHPQQPLPQPMPQQLHPPLPQIPQIAPKINRTGGSATPHCLVCNVHLGMFAKGGMEVFSEKVTTSFGKMQIHNVLGSIINQELNTANVHSSIVCKKCFKLLDDIDGLEGQLVNMKQVVSSKYTMTLALVKKGLVGKAVFEEPAKQPPPPPKPKKPIKPPLTGKTSKLKVAGRRNRPPKVGMIWVRTASSSIKSFHKSSLVRMHIKCRGSFYPRTNEKVTRTEVPDDKVEWSASFHDYAPRQYTAPHILAGPEYADPDISCPEFKPLWNAVDGNINRCSHEESYNIVDGYPRNMHGRTGIAGRGALGRWGPNHAADPIVTRWKIYDNEVAHGETGKPILQFVCIQRRDSGEWAIPGGMVDPGERVSTTLMREFQEEALNCLEMTHEQKKQTEDKLKNFFQGGEEVYRGYVDDPRNTDNAWMETVAYNFHESSQDGILYSLQLHAGDDAQAVKWQDISSQLNLYASHRDFIQKVAEKHNAHW